MYQISNDVRASMLTEEQLTKKIINIHVVEIRKHSSVSRNELLRKLSPTFSINIHSKCLIKLYTVKYIPLALSFKLV